MSNHDLSATTKTKLINRLFKYTGYSAYRSSVDKNGLLDRLNDVAQISVEPRYIFDECLSYFGQHTLALAGYTTLQDVISSVLSIERRRIDDILNKHLSSHTKETLLNLLRSNNTFTELSKIKKVAKDFSQSQITQELKTHSIIRNLYPIVKTVISELALSPKNFEYYATLVRHKSVYKLRRHEDSQTLLYLICYLFFRYRETNDNLVAAFIYSVRKLNDSAKTFAKQRISDDFDIVKTQLKSAGNLLKYFVDGAIEDDLSFGEVRKKAFKLISAKNIQLLSEHLDTNDFDGRKYEWQYIDTQTNKIRNLLRLLFLAIWTAPSFIDT